MLQTQLRLREHVVKHVSWLYQILEGSWIVVQTVKFVFETGAWESLMQI